MGRDETQMALEPFAGAASSGVGRYLRKYGFRLGAATAVIWLVVQFVIVAHWYDWFEKRVVVVVPGQLVRGAFQRPLPLSRLIAREHIKTVVTLASYSDEDRRFRDQHPVILKAGVNWHILPIKDSRPSLEQMREASDLLARVELRPIFFHCIAGHHRTSLALAAYRIRHEGWSAEQAWAEISALPWARPDTDRFDRRQVEAFTAKYGGPAALAKTDPVAVRR